MASNNQGRYCGKARISPNALDRPAGRDVRVCPQVSVSTNKQIWRSENGSRFSFLLGQLSAFLGALAASFGATGESFDFGMLGAGFRQLVTGMRTNIENRVGVFRASLEELTGQRRDPGNIPRDGSSDRFMPSSARPRKCIARAPPHGSRISAHIAMARSR